MSKLIKIIKYTKSKIEIKKNKLSLGVETIKSDFFIGKTIIMINLFSKFDYQVQVMVNENCLKLENFKKDVSSLNIEIPIVTMNDFTIIIENEKEKEEIKLLNEKNKIDYESNVSIIEKNSSGLRYLKYYWNNQNSWFILNKDMELFSTMNIVEFIISEERKEDLLSLKEHLLFFNNIIFTKE